MASAVETYESRQNYSAVNAWLHSYRFRHLLRTAHALARPGQPLRVLDVGCAYGKAFAALDAALAVHYVGVDLDPAFIEEANQRYGGRANFSAHCASAELFLAGPAREMAPFDFIFALETLEHVPAGVALRAVEAIAALKPRKFVASVPVEIGPAILFKNFGSMATGYVRHQEYSLADTLWASIYRLDKVAPHAYGHKGFDWRWLAHTIHQSMPIERVRRFPFSWLPSALATTVYIEAAPAAE